MKPGEKYELVIGLEVHAQLLTKSKLFCGDSAAFSTEPNIHVSPVTLAHPGTLPKMNSKAIEYAIKLGIALHCDIEQHNYFARKNYFYPDLPKGYQVSQHTTPICKNGFVKIITAGAERKILLNRIHIEEDAGKSLHDVDEQYTSIDLNRAGVPLLEIVSEPDLHSSDEAFEYITALRKLVRWLGICDGNMEEGSMRCDANISIRIKGETKLGTRVEVKNLNSIRNVKRAIDFEFERLAALMDNGKPIIQETRSYDADNGLTFSLRTKEDADDYRYFPEPDLTPFHISDQYLEEIKKGMPESSESLEKKYTDIYQLSNYDAAIICDDKEHAQFFEAVIQYTDNYKAVANWILGPVKNYLNEHKVSINKFPVTHEKLALLISLVETGTISFNNAATKILNSLLITNPDQDPLQIATALNLLQENNSASLEAWVNEVITKMPDEVMQYKKGKTALIGLFAGAVKKISNGKADMQIVNKILTEKLKN